MGSYLPPAVLPSLDDLRLPVPVLLPGYKRVCLDEFNQSVDNLEDVLFCNLCATILPKEQLQLRCLQRGPNGRSYGRELVPLDSISDDTCQMFATFNDTLQVAREQRTLRSQPNHYQVNPAQLRVRQDDSQLMEVAASAAVSMVQLGFTPGNWGKDRILGPVGVQYACGTTREAGMGISLEIPDMTFVYALGLPEGAVPHVLALEGEILAEWALDEAEQDRLVHRAHGAGIHLIIVSVGGISNENSLMFLSALGKIIPPGGSITFIHDQDLADAIGAHIAESEATKSTPEHMSHEQVEAHEEQPTTMAATEQETGQKLSKSVGDKKLVKPEDVQDMLATYEVATGGDGFTVSHVLWKFLRAASEKPQVRVKKAMFRDMEPLFNVQAVVEGSLNRLPSVVGHATGQLFHIKFNDGLEVTVSKDENQFWVRSDAMPVGEPENMSIAELHRRVTSSGRLENLQRVYDTMTSSLADSERNIIQDGLAKIKEFHCNLGLMLKPLRSAATERRYEMAETLLIRNALYNMVGL